MHVHKKPLLISILIFALMVQVILENQISVFGYLDEFVAVLSILYILLNSKGMLKKDILKPVFIIIVLTVIGGGWKSNIRCPE